MQKTLTKTANSIWMLAVAFLVFSMTCCSIAQAQIQPTYIRPSKGKVIEAITNVTTTTTSAVYDWSAFDGAYLLGSSSGNCVLSLTTNGFTSPTAAAGSQADINDPNTTYSDSLVGTRFTFFIAIPTPYVRFTVNIGAGACPGGFSLIVSPVPLTQRMGTTGQWAEGKVLPFVSNFYPVPIGGIQKTYDFPAQNIVKLAKFTQDGSMRISTQSGVGLTDPVAVTVNNSITLVRSGNAQDCNIKIVNTDTTVAYCAASNVLSATTGYPLSAASGPGLAGGSLDLPNFGGSVYCITSAGTTTVRALALKCQ